MTLVDTTVWIDFLRGTATTLGLPALLEADSVLTHSWVIGELSLGNLGPRRAAILSDLGSLPRCPVIPDDEIRDFVERRDLHGLGIGWVDAHLLGSALVASATLWTHDRPLRRAAWRVGVKPHAE